MGILFSITLIIISISSSVQSQHKYSGRQQTRAGSIKGTILDYTTSQPIEYATIMLFKEQDSSNVTGISADSVGYFELNRIRPGKYYLTINFIGYDSYTINNLEISRGNREIILDTIFLKQNAVSINDVTVTGQKSPIEFHIDKKIINVSEQLSSKSGTAVEVLENVPSVTVDIEGNVNLRGSSNFTLLISGRPSVLNPNDALQQIPASTIDNIEIITNPSAKYEPDGTSGIINVVLKEDRPQSISGISNLNLGLDDKYGGDIMLNRRLGRIDLMLSVNYNKRYYPGKSERENITTYDNTTFNVLSNGTNERGREYYGIRSGAEIELGEKDLINFNIRYGHFSMNGESVLAYDEWEEQSPEHNLYTSINNTDRGGNFLSAISEYTHNFSDNGHQLTGQALFNYHDMSEKSTNELHDRDNIVTFGQKSTEDGPSKILRIKIDYTKPFEKGKRLEIGYQSRIGNSSDDNTLYNYDPESLSYIFEQDYSQQTDYYRDIQSLYATFSGTKGKLGYQVGLREEYTYRKIEFEGESFTIDRWDYYPTIHSSYKISESKQVMASYTRRLNRTRGWLLEPFITWVDAYNVRSGNPDLQPEFIDSYEASYQTSLHGNIISVEAYYRITHNMIDFVKSVYEQNVILRKAENVGKDYSFGTEIMINSQFLPWWRINLMGNLFNYRVEGVLNDRAFSNSDFSWNLRLNNTLNLTKMTRCQIDGAYNSKKVTSQGTRSDYFTVNFGINQEFFNQVISATLQVRDVFSTSKHESISEGIDFYNYSSFERKAPTVTLTISYNFNTQKKDQRRRQNMGDQAGEDDF